MEIEEKLEIHGDMEMMERWRRRDLDFDFRRPGELSWRNRWRKKWRWAQDPIYPQDRKSVV